VSPYSLCLLCFSSPRLVLYLHSFPTRRSSDLLYRALPYDPVKDFTMVWMVGSNPMVVLTNPGFAAKTMQELVQRAKAAPGQINYGSGGIGSGMHLAAVLFQARTGVTLNHVPYKGGNAGPVALLANEIP